MVSRGKAIGWSSLFLGLLLVFGAVRPPSPEAAPPPEFTLKMAIISRAAAYNRYSWDWMVPEIERRTKGRVKVQLTSLPELGLTGLELVQALKSGVIDMAELVPGYLTGDVPIVEGASLPGMAMTREVGEEAHRAWRDILVQNQGKYGSVFLTQFPTARHYIWSRAPIDSLQSLRGKKIRYWAGAQSWYLQGLGAEGAFIPQADVYTALERGVLDGAINAVQMIIPLKWHEVIKYQLDIGIGLSALFGVASKKTWDRLPPDIQAVLRDVGAELEKRSWEESRRMEAEYTEKNRKAGITAIDLRPEWQGELKRIMRERVVPAWINRSGPEAKAAFNQRLGPVVGFTIP